MAQHRDFGFFFWLHCGFVVASYLSPFFLAWQFILIGIAVYYAQWFLFGACILTLGEFRRKDNAVSFHAHYLEKLGLRFNRTRLDFFTGYIFPPIVFVFALVWQTALGHVARVSWPW